MKSVTHEKKVKSRNFACFVKFCFCIFLSVLQPVSLFWYGTLYPLVEGSLLREDEGEHWAPVENEVR